jgi:NAD(P)-dependent dehydrogenase (short-subunit alcohol dehydrogenase family)
MNEPPRSDACDSLILVTGATDGLGRALVLALARGGHRLLVHGRRSDAVEAVCGLALREGARSAEGAVADLASLRQVSRLAAAVGTRGDVEVVINNAGVGFGGPGDSTRQKSLDGVELRMAVNYLAPMVLTHQLLSRCPPRRVIQVASIGQHPLDFSDVESVHGYDPVTAYRRSKLALITGSMDLAAGTRSTTINCVHPGTYLPTKMVLDSGVAPVDDLSVGVGALIHLAVAPEIGTRTGEYFEGTRPARAHAQAYDATARSELRAWTSPYLSARPE